MHVPVSACLIVKNDPHLERTVTSVRPYVDEICIVDTGSTDGTDAVARRLADRFEAFTGCNFEDGEIADFSAARAKSFALASHETVLWLDSDDVIEGGEQIQAAIAWAVEQAHGQPWRAKFPYAYDFDVRGRCLNWQKRERIVHPASAFRWVHRVHEGLTAIQPDEWMTLEPPQAVAWKHEADKTKPRSRRNLRILRDHVKSVGVENVDAKTQFDLGMEFAKAGDHALALGWLNRYVHTSDLDDDRVLACLHMVDVYSFWPGREQDAALWANKASEIRPDWPEGYWAMAKIAYGIANRTKDKTVERRQLVRTAHFARKGLACGEPLTDVPVNPIDRTVHIPWILQDALTRLGDHRGALDAARICAEANQGDVATLLRLRECEMRVDSSKALDVVIVCGITHEAWDPSMAASGGIGGSETAVIELGKRLAAMGSRVRVYCRCDAPGLYEGVEYRSMGESDEAAGCDLLIAWRNATLLETTPARVKWLWLHDTVAVGATPWNLSLADRILCLSPWHAEHVAKLYPAHARKITETRNGIDPARFDQKVARNPRRAIYSSSPDRGLDQLLSMWPSIRDRVPDAELHVFYGFANMPAEAARGYLEKLEAMADEGVVVRGRVDQQTLATEMMSAGAWLYPSWCGDTAFEETSCIGAMEAQAAGLHIVTSTHGALPYTVERGEFIFGDATSFPYQSEFVRAAVIAMTLPGPRPHGESFGWDAVAEAWTSTARGDVASTTPLRSIKAMGADTRPTLHMILAPQASGDVVLDAAGDPGSEAMGGGSRVGFLGLVKAMGELGTYRVRAFSTFKAPSVERDGVEYVRLDRMVGYPKPDAVLAYYDTSPLAAFGSDVLRIASHHTYAPYMHFDAADVNVAPSAHAMDALRDRFDPTGAWSVLPNAVGPMAIERRPVAGRVIYHTSPDRGLDVLLRAWPTIRLAVPNATLHVVGGVQEILDAKAPKGRHGDHLRAIQDAFAAAEPMGGIKLLGRLPRAELWRELGEASVFAFPCAPIAPCETFSISIMECCKIGIPVVLAPADALESIYGGHVRMAPSPARAHRDEFAQVVVDVLTSKTERDRLVAAGQELASQFTFARAAQTLDDIIYVQREARKAERICEAAE